MTASGHSSLGLTLLCNCNDDDNDGDNEDDDLSIRCLHAESTKPKVNETFCKKYILSSNISP